MKLSLQMYRGDRGRKLTIYAKSSSYIALLYNFTCYVVKGQSGSLPKCLLERGTQRKGLHVYLSS